jgi:tetratricopeptide (TPR) repeat protein
VKRIALLVTLAAAAPAAAQPSSNARNAATAAYQEGQRRYLDEDYAAAAAQFEAAYRLDPDPAYLFNIAQAYRLAKDCPKALAFYKQFLAAVPKAPNAEAVKKYIAELETTCGKREPDQPRIDTKPDTRVIERPAASPQPSHLRRNLAIGAFGVGAVGITLGAVFTFKVGSLESEREGLCPEPCNWTVDDTLRETQLKADGDRASKLAITGYVVGGLAVATGIALLVTSPAHADVVTIAPTQGGAFVSWTLHK